jgi:hypothetical protein
MIAQPATSVFSWRLFHWITFALAGVIVASAFLPWEEVHGVGVFTKNGTEFDGVWTLLIAVALGAVAFGNAWRVVGHRETLALIFLGGAIVALVGFIDWADIERSPDGSALGNWHGTKAGIGLRLTTLAGVATATVPIVVWRIEATRRPQEMGSQA